MGYSANEQPRFDDRNVARNFSYLVMVEGGYFGENLPEPGVVCPEDRDALVWQKNVRTPLDGLTQTGDPDPASSVGFKNFMPFWSTYQMVPCAWSPDLGTPYPVSQDRELVPGSHLLYGDSGLKLGGRRIDEVGYPSQKVMLFDLFDRHSAKRMRFYAYPRSIQPLLFFDGQVTMRKTGDADRGWDPNDPTSPNPTVYHYYPAGNEPPTESGHEYDDVYGYYRWTRKGLNGLDYGGKP
jgi:hypothetical protein